MAVEKKMDAFALPDPKSAPGLAVDRLATLGGDRSVGCDRGRGVGFNALTLHTPTA